jgi:antitoxin ParD1/3/4
MRGSEDTMGKNTSIALGDHFTAFLAAQVATGRYGSASEVIRAGLRLLEEREAKLEELRALIDAGEASGDPVPFEPEKWLAEWKAERAVNDRHTSPRRA